MSIDLGRENIHGDSLQGTYGVARDITDRKQMGLTVRAYCGVIREPDTGWEEVARMLAEVEGVVSVTAVSGDVDLMLEIVARDMQHYSLVVLHKLSKIKGVSATRSSFVLEEVKSIY